MYITLNSSSQGYETTIEEQKLCSEGQSREVQNYSMWDFYFSVYHDNLFLCLVNSFLHLLCFFLYLCLSIFLKLFL